MLAFWNLIFFVTGSYLHPIIFLAVTLAFPQRRPTTSEDQGHPLLLIKVPFIHSVLVLFFMKLPLYIDFIVSHPWEVRATYP